MFNTFASTISGSSVRGDPATPPRSSGASSSAASPPAEPTTRQHAVVAVRATALHHEAHLLGDGDVSSGSPGTAMTSASSPASSRPRSSTSMSSAATVVAARMAWSGVMPRSTSAISSLALRPWGMAGASVPQAIFAPRVDRLADRLLGPREHLGRLGLQLGGGVRGVHAVGQVGRRHEEGAPLDHQVQGLVGHERAVLDAVDAGLDGGADAVVAVGVGRDPQPGAVRLVDDRRQLLVGVLLRAGRPGVRHHPARRADLDELGAVLDLVADRLAHLVDAVGDPLLHGERHDVRGRAPGTSSGRGGRRSGEMAWPAGTTRGPSIQPKSIAFFRATSSSSPPVCTNRPRFRTVVNPARRVRRALATPRSVFTAGSSCTATSGLAWSGPPMQEVDLHVHEPGEQREVAEVDHDGVVGHRGRGDRR